MPANNLLLRAAFDEVHAPHRNLVISYSGIAPNAGPPALNSGVRRLSPVGVSSRLTED